jgi:hypothetical protein
MALVTCCAAAAAAALVSPVGPITTRLLGHLAAPSPSPSITPGPEGVFGGPSSCSGLYFVSARGSGQPYGRTNENAIQKATDMSVSPETDAVLTGIEDELKAKGMNPPIVADQLGPGYQADSINVLWSGLSPNESVKAKWDRITEVNVPKYIGGEEDGEAELNGYLTEIAYDCYPSGHEPMIVLAGYSQGSMVIHNIMNTLAADDDTGYMSMIKGAVLIADPERMSFSNVLNLGTATASDYGICHLVDDIAPSANKNLCEPPEATADIAKYYSPVARQVCNTGDIVCDTSSAYEKSDGFLRAQSPQTLWKRIKAGMTVHTSSYTTSELISTGRGIALNLIQDGLGTAGSPSSDPSSTSPSTPAPASTTPAPPTSTSTATPPTGTGSDGWTAAEAPIAGGYGTDQPDLNAITCPGAADCVALGTYYDSSRQHHTALMTGSGTSWTVTDAPVPANNEVSPYGPALYALTCPTASTCVAVGEYYDSAGNEQALIVTLSGTTWTATEAPLPAGAQPSGPRGAYLNSVACSSATDCVAAGVYFDSSGDSQGLIVSGSGTSWTATKAPLPANAQANPDVTLHSVACAALSCAAIGDYTDSSGDNQGLLLAGSNTAWTPTEAPLPANASTPGFVGLDAVACPSDAACMAVGGYYDSSGNTQGMLLTGSGSSWTAAQAPLPADASTGDPSVALVSVTCPSSSSCVAVGSYDGSTTDDHLGLILTGWGSSWTAIESPAPSNTATPQGTGLSAVTCASATACVATGQYTDSTTNQYAFLVTGAGSSWTAAIAPLPSNAGAIDTGGGGDADQITALACASATACYGVGTYWDGSTNWDAAILSGPA